MPLLCPEGPELPSMTHDSECALCSAMQKGTRNSGEVEENTVLMKSFVRANLAP